MRVARRWAWLAIGCTSACALPPAPAPPVAPSPSPPAQPCPEAMAFVADRFCIDRWEASLVEIGEPEVAFSPYEAPGSRRVRAVSRPGVVPQGYISRDEAAAACLASHKRLCAEDEWLAACRGEPARRFPYGDAKVTGACNDRGISPLHVYYPEAPETYLPGPMNDPRLNRTRGTVARTGEFAGCAGAAGVFDMVGNLHEWVLSSRPTFRGGYYLDTRLNGEGCAYRTTAHAAAYHDYSTGFRCCADPGARR